MQNLWKWGENRQERVSLVLIAGFLGTLLIAGGSSRADVLGQFVVRLAAWILVIATVLRRAPLLTKPLPPALIGLGILATIMVLQLIPLPPAIWMALPGREIVADTALALAEPQPWRAISLSPSATLNSLGALIIPLAIILAAKDLSYNAHRVLGLMVLALVFAGCLQGITQIVGTAGDNPLINDIKGMVGGNFANRNHFALFLAIGMVLLGLVVSTSRLDGRAVTYAALISTPIVVLMAIATGSRMGLLLLALAMVLAGILSLRRLKRLFAKRGRAPAYAAVLVPCMLVVTTIGLSVLVGRAVSVDRVMEMDISQDYRSQALPVLLDMIARYFPFGSGFGTFDPVFRISEPDDLLRSAYFNHAHNDWLEALLDGGVLSVVLGAVGIYWWAQHFYRAWWTSSEVNRLARAGSGIILLCLIASLSDYPLRTPMMMAVFAIAGLWSAFSGEVTVTRSEGRVD